MAAVLEQHQFGGEAKGLVASHELVVVAQRGVETLGVYFQQCAQVEGAGGEQAVGERVKRTKVDTFVLVKLFLLLPHAGAIEEKPFKTMT